MRRNGANGLERLNLTLFGDGISIDLIAEKIEMCGLAVAGSGSART